MGSAPYQGLFHTQGSKGRSNLSTAPHPLVVIKSFVKIIYVCLDFSLLFLLVMCLSRFPEVTKVGFH